LLDRVAGLLTGDTPAAVVVVRVVPAAKTGSATDADGLDRAAADRLAAVADAAATIARLDTDCFAIATVQDRDGAEALAERVRAAFAEPLAVDDDTGTRPTDVDVIADVAVAVADAGEGPEELVGRAEAALAPDAWAPGSAASLLRHAMEHDGLRVLYQPIIDVEREVVVGAEALLRVQSAQDTTLSPAAFVEAAESAGLISQLGLQVLRMTCEQLAAWGEDHGDSVEAFVNVSPRQLADPALGGKIEAVLEATGVASRQLNLEITQGILISAEATVDTTIAHLRRLGVRIGLDDFGTGHSSLGYLKRFPLDFVKIDQSLVAGLGVHENDTAIVRATVELAHTLGLDVCAVGVETDEQLEALGILGCDRAQGYLFAPAMAADDLGAMMAGDASDFRA
jgi:EAL domain-containing protein (putative c-di-GMP-specific phosphodiesterase class I)